MKIIPIFLFLFLSACATNQSQSVSREESSEGLTPLHIAAGKADISEMTNLFNRGADVNALDSKMGVSVLHKAVYSGRPEAVRFLLSHGALINTQSSSNGDSPLHDAIYFKKKAFGAEIIDILLKGSASLSIRNRAGLTPLESAELLKDKESISLLKKEMERRSSFQGRALMEAVKQNDLAKVQRLLTNVYIPLEETDEEGFTPLLWASREGFFKIVNVLLDRGANPNHLDSWMGANAGHKAAFWGRTQVMKLLVVHNLEINARGLYNGYTPLHDAVTGNHVETVRVLVLAGAKTDIQGHDGKTPVDIARENNNSEILKILGANPL